MRLHLTSSVNPPSMHVRMQYANMTDVRCLPNLSEVSTEIMCRRDRRILYQVLAGQNNQFKDDMMNIFDIF